MTFKKVGSFVTSKSFRTYFAGQVLGYFQENCFKKSYIMMTQKVLSFPSISYRKTYYLLKNTHKMALKMYEIKLKYIRAILD